MNLFKKDEIRIVYIVVVSENNTHDFLAVFRRRPEAEAYKIRYQNAHRQPTDIWTVDVLEEVLN